MIITIKDFKITEHSLKDFTDRIDKISNFVIKLNFVDYFSQCLKDLFIKNEITTVTLSSMYSFMDFILNIYNFASTPEAIKFIQHIVVGTCFVQEVSILQ